MITLRDIEFNSFNQLEEVKEIKQIGKSILLDSSKTNLSAHF